MSGEKITINRRLVGFLTLVCWAAALSILLFAPSDEKWKLWLGGFMRVGLLMSAFWLALPTRHREAAWANVSPWTLVGILAAIVAAALPRFRGLFPILLIAVVLSLVLRPRAKRRPGARPNRSS